MKINKSDLSRNLWWEDAEGNILDVEDEQGCFDKDKVPDGATHHTQWVLEIREDIDSYCWRPKTLLQKHLCLIKPIRKLLEKKHKNDRTFNHLVSFNTHIGGGNEDVIIAMVNSGDYRLSEAIKLYANCCERCMNVLAYKYLDGKDGYPEYSKEWKNCNTVCNFCREECNCSKIYTAYKLALNSVKKQIPKKVRYAKKKKNEDELIVSRR